MNEDTPLTNEATGVRCPHGTDTGFPCPRCAEELEGTMLRWEPGTLRSRTLSRILQDTLADIWGDCYRRGEPRFQGRVFAEKVADALFCATGENWIVERR